MFIFDLQNIIHYGLHLIIFPGLVSFIYYKFFDTNWKHVFIVMLLTMLVDIDHILANPIFDPQRCSIGFHPLHTYPAIVFYFVLLFFKRTRIVAIGLLLHMLTDFQDCLFWM
jgi:hypothetical protein